MSDPIIVDGNSLIVRSIMGSVHEELRLHLPFRGGVYGALNTLRYILDRPEVDAGRVFVCFDHAPPARRKRLIPGYKAHKDDPTKTIEPFETLEQKQEAMNQLWLAWELFELLGVTCLRYTGREGDDTVAAVARLQIDNGRRPLVVTSDSDLWQIIGWGARVWDLRNQEAIDAGNFVSHAGVSTDCWTLFRGLVGGKDGIPGARGLGRAKAIKLFERAHWYIRLSRDPVAQLGGLCDYIGRKKAPGVVETRIVADRARLARSVQGVDLNGSFGPLDGLRERLRRPRPKPDKMAFLRRCSALGLKGVMQTPQRFTEPFLRAGRKKTGGRGRKRR